MVDPFSQEQEKVKKIIQEKEQADKESNHLKSISKEKYRDLFDEHVSIMFILDPETGRIIDANKAAVDFYGYSYNRLRSKSIFEINTMPEEAVKQEMQRAKSNKKNHFHFQHRLADGTVKNVEVRSAPFYINNEKFLCSIIHDETARVQAEQALRKREEELEIFFSQSMDGCFFMVLDEPVYWNDSVDKEEILDYVFAHQRVAKVNQAMLEQYGLKEEEFLGLTPNNLFAHDIKGGKEVWRKFFDEGKLVIDTKESKKDGSLMYIEGGYVCLYDEKGRIWGHFGIQREVTRRKEMEQELIIAKDTAQRANKAKSEFLANMSHEIRTPLNSVIGMTDIIMNTKLSNEQRNYLETVKASADHLLEIINDVLDFSKIEAGELEISNEDFDLTEILTSTVKMFDFQIKERNLILKLDYPRDIPIWLKGDPDRLRQIIVNLIGNALKFTAKGEIELKVRLDSKKKFENRIPLVFSVRDTGVGISEEMQENIFREFKQGSVSRSSKHKGTGLGLAISSRLVKMMNGEIWFESEEGKGSIFSFYIPFGLCVRNFYKDNKERNKQDKFDGKLKILLAEDNKVNIKVAAKFIERMGHDYIVAENGQRVLQLIRSDDFDMVIMDVEMPVIDGLEATRMIRRGDAGESNKGIPIIAMTAHALSEFKEKCREAEMNDYITKPLSFYKFRDTLVKNITNFFAERDQVYKEEDIEDILNVASALKRLGGDKKLLEEMKEMFLADLPEDLKELKAAISGNKSEEIADIAHSFKSSAGWIGADSARECARSLQIAAKDADPEKLRELGVCLVKELEQVRQVLSSKKAL